ncbi:uncharacterized protein N0V89_000401 [Didymosphaeria variabile]|uniref:Transcription factor domain-containing protein n=1 Tax=Didymosphaeria variabile TaxID=1932322 RepID=A0A9W8XW21_9PLEO|nr:uncharacterized protein N0V89_000401 [Didymosphaeria variabile]KAJ4359845.1 hypothetical protein N0V89_000401 [Didymosphaeria variabile]
MLDDLGSVFHHFYDIGLTAFRAELAESAGSFNEGTLAAGLLLCTVGIVQGTPWTIHIDHLDDLFIAPQETIGFRNLSAYTSHAIEVAGVMDLPTYQLGRPLPCRHIWRRFRAYQANTNSLKPGVEPVSGLPRSLLDCFARIEDPDSIDSFWLWPGELGESAQCLLWEAYRLAGVLVALRLHRTLNPTTAPVTKLWSVPDRTILVNRLIANIDSVQRSVSTPAESQLLVTNALVYPVFVAGMHVTYMHRWPNWKQVVLDFFTISMANDKINNTKHVLEILQDAWAHDNHDFDFDDAAKRKGLEIALL